jgi:hypothetical protein
MDPAAPANCPEIAPDTSRSDFIQALAFSTVVTLIVVVVLITDPVAVTLTGCAVCFASVGVAWARDVRAA